MEVVLDLETLGTKSDAVILSIGAVAFKLGDSVYKPTTFESFLDIKTQREPFFSVDRETLLWWAEPDQRPAFEFMFFQDREREAVVDAVYRFGNWIQGMNVDGFWANGSTFDFPILKNAIAQTGQDIEIPFRKVFDIRTLRRMNRSWNLLPDDPASPPMPIAAATAALEALGDRPKHDALWDAFTTGHYLWSSFQKGRR